MAVNTLKRSNSSQELDLPEICAIPEEYSLDIACGKPVLERCNHPEELTKSVSTGMTVNRDTAASTARPI